MRAVLRMVALLTMAGACTSILDFDGYEYVEPPGSGGAGNTSTSSTIGVGGAGATSSSAQMTSSSAGGSGAGPECQSHLECTLNQYCNRSGDCVPDKALGDNCNDAEECPDEDCEDGVCCDGECEGICEACNLLGNEGTCTFVPSGQDPNNDCPGACDGNGSCI